jgi:hypothetical protein
VPPGEVLLPAFPMEPAVGAPWLLALPTFPVVVVDPFIIVGPVLPSVVVLPFIGASVEVLPAPGELLCAKATVPESARTVATAIVLTLMVVSSVSLIRK